jgi:hypothetical protein
MARIFKTAVFSLQTMGSADAPVGFVAIIQAVRKSINCYPGQAGQTPFVPRVLLTVVRWDELQPVCRQAFDKGGQYRLF